MHTIKERLAVWPNNRFVLAVVAILAFSGVALASKVPLIASWAGSAKTGRQLTILARADGTFDIKEFAKQNQWFGPDVVGVGLKMTAIRRFGSDVKLSDVSVLVRADPGVKDETIRIALISVGQAGFQRIGFTDPRLGAIARSIAAAPAPGSPSSVPGESVATSRRR
ncbi:MAG: hypothetical protein H7145_15165 [Akkermansiaceae bacterium]|nr:hypothetical protein [Armatimonadota bacterium]